MIVRTAKPPGQWRIKLSTTKKILQDLIKEALENNGEDSILLKRPEIIKEEETLQTAFAELKPSEEVEDMLNRAEKLSPPDLAKLYFDIQQMYLASKED